MVRTVVQGNLYVNYIVACENTCLHCAADTCINSGNILFRYSTANDLVDELISLAGLVGLDCNLDMTILTFTAGLSCILAILIHSLGNSLLVRNLGLAYICLNLKFTQKSVYDYLEVKLAHAGDDCLTCFLVRINAECRVFLGKLGKCDTHFFLTCFCLGLYGNLDNRLREFHGFENDRMLFVAKGITCCGILCSDYGCDIAAVADIDILSLVCVHLEDTTEALSLMLVCVICCFACCNLARVYAEEAKLSYIRVGHDLEGESRKRLFIGRNSFLFLTCIGVYTLDSRNIDWRGHIIDNRIQKLLNTLVLI